MPQLRPGVPLLLQRLSIHSVDGFGVDSDFSESSDNLVELGPMSKEPICVVSFFSVSFWFREAIRHNTQTIADAARGKLRLEM
jgi:hypothetical protein